VSLVLLVPLCHRTALDASNVLKEQKQLQQLMSLIGINGRSFLASLLVVKVLVEQKVGFFLRMVSILVQAMVLMSIPGLSLL